MMVPKMTTSSNNIRLIAVVHCRFVQGSRFCTLSTATGRAKANASERSADDIGLAVISGGVGTRAPAWEKTVEAGRQSAQPSRQTGVLATIRPSANHWRIISSRTGPNCSPEPIRTYHLVEDGLGARSWLVECASEDAADPSDIAAGGANPTTAGCSATAASCGDDQGSAGEMGGAAT